MSAFTTQFGSGCNQSLITLCGLDHRPLYELPLLFEPVYNNFSPYSAYIRVRGLLKGRFGGPKSMNALQCFTMYLARTRGQGTREWLCLEFGVRRIVADIFMCFARRILVRTVRSQAEAAIKIPSFDEIVRFKQDISDKHPLLHDAFCLEDGLKVRLQQSGNQMI